MPVKALQWSACVQMQTEQDLPVRAQNATVVLVLGDIDTNVDHNQILLKMY